MQNTAEEDCTKDAKTLISDYRAKNCDKVVIATLNLNSLPNKFSSLAEIISNNIDILVIEETKIDESFPEGQFLIPGYKNIYIAKTETVMVGVLSSMLGKISHLEN